MMTRIRSVKPELFNHEGLFRAELQYQLPLRLAFIGLFTCCDREGRFRWQLGRLKLSILPYDNIDITVVLDALVVTGFVKKYENNGDFYGCIPSWLRHQHINNRESESDLPSIENSVEVEVTNCKIIKEIEFDFSRVVDACPTRDAQVPDASGACTRGRERKGREQKGRERNRSIVASTTRPDDRQQPIEQIFLHWKTMMHHPNARLDQKRRNLIGNALKFGYSSEQLCEAITGCSYTPHNTGDNDRGQRYDGLHVILRNADQIDRFIHNCHRPPRPTNESERRSNANVQTLQDWMTRKMTEETANASK